MQPYSFAMRPVGNNQINPYFNPQMVDPGSQLLSYQVSLQFRQCATLTMNPSFNPQMMHPMNTCPYPPSSPQINPSLNPQMISNVNPQLMAPGSIPSVSQQMMHMPNMTQFQVPSLNCPSVMPGRSPTMQTVNLSQSIPSLNPQMIPPMNCQSFQPVNSQNNYSPISHIPSTSSRAIPPLMSQSANPSNYPQNVQNVNYPNMPIINSQTVMSVREQVSSSNSRAPTPAGGQTFSPSSNPQNYSPSPNSQAFRLSAESPSFYPSPNSQSYSPSSNRQNYSPSANSQIYSPSSNPQNYSPSANSQNYSPTNSQTYSPTNSQTYSPSPNSQNYSPLANPQNYSPSANSQNYSPSSNLQNYSPSPNSQIFRLSAESPSFYPSPNSQNFSPSANSQNNPLSDNPQTYPSSVNTQQKPNAGLNATNAKRQRIRFRGKKKTGAPGEETSDKKEKKNIKPSNIFWEDPAYKKSKTDSGKGEENNEGKSVPHKRGLIKQIQNLPWKNVKLNLMKMRKKKKEKNEKKEKKDKKGDASKPGKVASSDDSKSGDIPFITIKPKGDKPLDDKKMEYFKSVKPVSMVSRKERNQKRLSENDKIKARILKIFALMQKLKGTSKKLWQNVAANGEFKDNPAVPEEVTKFLMFSQKFMGEVECIVKLTKKEESSSTEILPKETETNPKDSGKNSNKDQTSETTATTTTIAPATTTTTTIAAAATTTTTTIAATTTTTTMAATTTTAAAGAATKQPAQKRTRTVPFTLKLLLKKLDVLDALGLCFVNINGIFIKRYCSVIVKLRKSLNALLDKSKTSLKKKRLKIPRPPCLPQWGAIMLTCYGKTTYSNALHLAMKNIKFKSLGIQCIKKRRSVTGGLILEVFADENYEMKTDLLAEKLQEIYASLEVRVTRPQKYGELVITRLDPTATVEQICEQLGKLGNCSPDIFKTGSMGKTCIWVRCPLNIAIQLDQKTIQMKSTVAKINLKAKKFVRCYKCFNMGHVKEICPSVIDHNNMCFKCGLSNHAARTCHNMPRCLACYDNSLPTCHRLGGEKCPSAIPKFIKRPPYSEAKKNENSKKKGKGPRGKNVSKKKSVTTPSISNIKPAGNEVRSRN